MFMKAVKTRIATLLAALRAARPGSALAVLARRLCAACRASECGNDRLERADDGQDITRARLRLRFGPRRCRARYNRSRADKLCAILVGTDAQGRLYADSQRKLAVVVGVQYELIELPETARQEQVHAEIDRLNADPSVTGIILQLPLPPHIDAAAAQYHIDPYKDVEGVNPANIGWLFYGEPIIAPCTALAVNEMIRRSGVAVRGAEAVVVGQSRIVGKPVTMFLLEQMATVTGCQITTQDLASHTRRADILVVAVGRPQLIGAEHVKPGAVVIDVGINRITETDAAGKKVRRTVGDVDFDVVAPSPRRLRRFPAASAR